MENNNQNQNAINSPLCAICVIYIIKCLGILGGFAYLDLLSKVLNFIFFILLTLSVFWAYKGMIQKIFYLYKRAVIISLIISIFSTIFRIISLISVIKYKTKSKDERSAKNIVLYSTIIGFLFDWLLTLVLFLYRKRVEDYCENAPNPPNVIAENADNTPLA